MARAAFPSYRAMVSLANCIATAMPLQALHDHQKLKTHDRLRCAAFNRLNILLQRASDSLLATSKPSCSRMPSSLIP